MSYSIASTKSIAISVVSLIRKRPSILAAFLAACLFLLSIYYLIALIAIYAHASALTFGWRENKNLAGLALSSISFPRSASASSDSSLIQLDVSVRNSALSQIVLSGLTLKVDAAGIPRSKLYPRSSITDDSPATLFDISSNGALVLPGRKSFLSNPQPEFPATSPPSIQMSLNVPATQQWLQSVVGLIARMPLSEGYTSSSTSSSSFREEIADLRVSGGANVVLSWLWPFTVTISASSRVSLSKVFESLGNAAISGNPGGQFSFSSLFSTLGGSVSSSALYGVYQDIAKILGTQTLAVRIPFDITGDVIAWYGFQRAEAAAAAATGTSSASASTTTSSTSCCCSASSASATPSSSPLPEYKTLSSNLVFPAARPYGMTYGLAKVNSSGLLQPTHSSVSVLFCRMSNDLISASDVLLMRDIAKEIDALTSSEKRKIRPGKTVVGASGIRTNNQEGPLSPSDQQAALKSATEGKVARVKELVSFRRPDLCSKLAPNLTDSIFGLTSFIPPMTLLAVSGRPGFINIDGEIKTDSSSLPGRLPSIASLRIASLSSSEAIAVELSVSASQISHARRTVREFVLGIDDGEPSSPLPLRGSPRTKNPINQKGVARLWSCSPQQTPIGLYAESAVSGSNEVHPLAGLFDGLFTCVTSPYIDAVAGIQGGVRVASSLPDVESLTLFRTSNTSFPVSGTSNKVSSETAAVHARGGATLVTGVLSTSYLSPEAASTARNGSSAFALRSFCLGDSLVTTSSNGKHLAGWAVGKGGNKTYAAHSLAGGNGQRDRGSLPLAAGILEHALPPFDQDPSETLSSAADPPWIYVRSTLLPSSSIVNTDEIKVDDGFGSIINTEETTVKVSLENNSPLCNVNALSGDSTKVSSPLIKNFRRRLDVDNDETIESEVVEKMTTATTTMKKVDESTLSNSKSDHPRNLSPSSIPGLEAFDDPLGGLLATFGSWYANELSVEYERLDWDPLTVWSGTFDELGWGGRSTDAYTSASGMSGNQNRDRAQDPCGLLLSHDISVLGSCCSNSSLESGGEGFGHEGYRTASASAVAKFKGSTLRTLLFNTIGDVQPIVLPTLLLRHSTFANVSYSKDASGSNSAEGSIKTEIAAVIRGCAVAVPDSSASIPKPGGARVPDTRKYGQIQGAYYADGDVYRVRLRATVSIIDPALIWGGAKRKGSLDATVNAQTNTDFNSSSARAIFDVLFNGATQGIADYSGEASSAAASLLLSAFKAQRLINATAQGLTSELPDEDVEVLPKPPSQWNLLDGDDSGDGNATNAFLAGSEWRISVASLPSTINTLRDRCYERNRDTQCFIKPIALLEQQRNGTFPVINNPPKVKVGGVETNSYPSAMDPFLWSLLSGLTFNLHLPTRKDTAEFRESRDRAWPQHMSALAAAISSFSSSSSFESSVSLLEMLGQGGFSPLTFAYSREAGNSIHPAPRVGVARNLIDVMTGHPKTDGGNWAVNKAVYAGQDWSIKDKDAIAARPESNSSVLALSNMNSSSTFICPIDALCLGSSTRTDGSGFIRGPNVTCAYPIVRDACQQRWNMSDPLGAALRVPIAINGSVALARACSALIDMACSEWTYEHTDFFLSRDQDVPNFIIRLPEIDLGNAVASVQVVPICFNEYGDLSPECDPQNVHTYGADAPSRFDAFSNHAATITFSGLRNDAAMLQKISMKMWLSFNPVSEEIGSKVSIQPLLYTKFWVRTLPASRSVLLVSLLTRTRLLTRLLSRHRQLDYSIPLRLFPLAAASAHFAAGGLVLKDFTSFTDADQFSPPTLASQALEPAEYPFKVGSTPLAQVYESLMRYHIWVDSTSGAAYLGIVLVNTMVSESKIDSFHGVTVSGVIRDDLSALSQTFSLTAGNASSIESVNNNCSLGIRLNEAPLDIARYGLESFSIRDIYTDSVSTTQIDTRISINGCSIVESSGQKLSIDAVATATGLSPIVLRQGVAGQWIKHISLPLLLVPSTSINSISNSYLESVFSTLARKASSWSPGLKSTSADASLSFSSVSTSTPGTFSLVPSFLRGKRPGQASHFAVSGSAIGSVAHILHITSGSVIAQVLSLPPFAVKLAPLPVIANGTIPLDFVLVPASFASSSSTATAQPSPSKKPTPKACPYLSDKGVCNCTSSSSSSSTPVMNTDPTAALKFKIEYIRMDFTPASRLWLSILFITNIISLLLCCIGCCYSMCCCKTPGAGSKRARSVLIPCCCSSFVLQCERICQMRKKEEEESESEKVIDTNVDDSSSSSSSTLAINAAETDEIEVKHDEAIEDSEGSTHKDTERLN